MDPTDAQISMTFSTQSYVVSAVALITVPVYLRILYIIVKHRKHFRSRFYTLTVSQGVIDIVGFLCYFTAFNIRGIEVLKPFYYSMDNTVFVNWTYEQTYLFLYARYIGIVMISVQRYATIIKAHGHLNRFMNSCSPLVFFAIQWVLPCLLCLDMFLVEMHWNNPLELNQVISKKILMIHYMKSIILPLLAVIVCVFCYAAIIRRLRQSQIKRITKEIQLCLQVIGLFISLIIITIHFTLQIIFTHLNMTDMIYTMRMFTPIWVSLLTFINPWTLLIMNRDIRTCIWTSHSLSKTINQFSVFSQTPRNGSSKPKKNSKNTKLVGTTF